MASPLGAPEQSFHRLPTRGRTTPPCRGGLFLTRREGRDRATSSPSAAKPRLSPGAGSALAPGPVDIPPITALPAGAAHAGCPGRCRGAAPSSWRPVNIALIPMFFAPLQHLQSKDYLLHTHAAALFSRINQCSPRLLGEMTRGCPSDPDSSPGNVAWPRPWPGVARTSCLLLPWPPAPWCPVPSGSSRPWGFCLSGKCL